MKPQNNISRELRHSAEELSGIFSCQKIIKKWAEQTEKVSSIDMIQNLHRELFKNDPEKYKLKSLFGSNPGEFRSEDVLLSNKNDGFLARGFYVGFLMSQYSEELDDRLRECNSRNCFDLERVVSNAAWSYYVFERIHPFLDGNGRIGRMIMDVYFKKANLKDLLYHDKRWQNNNNLSHHLYILDKVSESSSLIPLEIYILNNLKNRYLEPKTPDENDIRFSINFTLAAKIRAYSNTKNQSILDIWPKFQYRSGEMLISEGK